MQPWNLSVDDKPHNTFLSSEGRVRDRYRIAYLIFHRLCMSLTDLSYTLARSVDVEIIYCHAPNYFFCLVVIYSSRNAWDDDDDDDEYNHDVFYPRAMVR